MTVKASSDLYSRIILVLFQWIIKQDYKNKYLSMETGASLKSLQFELRLKTVGQVANCVDLIRHHM